MPVEIKWNELIQLAKEKGITALQLRWILDLVRPEKSNSLSDEDLKAWHNSLKDLISEVAYYLSTNGMGACSTYRHYASEFIKNHKEIVEKLKANSLYQNNDAPIELEHEINEALHKLKNGLTHPDLAKIDLINSVKKYIAANSLHNVDAEHYFFSHCRIFQGINSGEYLDKEDFLSYASQFKSSTIVKRDLEFAKWLEENTKIRYEDKIILYRYCDKNNEWGNYTLDDIYIEFNVGKSSPIVISDEDKEAEYNRGYGDGYKDAVKEAREEIRENYSPNK